MTPIDRNNKRSSSDDLDLFTSGTRKGKVTRTYLPFQKRRKAEEINDSDEDLLNFSIFPFPGTIKTSHAQKLKKVKRAEHSSDEEIEVPLKVEHLAPIERLPEEILVSVLERAVSNMRGLVALMKVNKRFNRLAKSQELIRHLFRVPMGLMDVKPPKAIEFLMNYGPSVSNLKLGFQGAVEGIEEGGFRSLLCVCPGVTTLTFQQVPSLRDEHLTNFSCCSLLTFLALKKCSNISDNGIADISLCAALEKIHLSHCSQVSLEGISKLSEITTLRSLALEGFSFLVGGLSFMTAFIRLESLELSDVRVPPTGYDPLINCKNLSQLKTNDDRHQIFESISSCTSLKTLVLRNCTLLTHEAVSRFSRLNNLTALKLKDCKILDDETAAILSAQTCLKALAFKTNAVLTDQGLRNLWKCTALTSLKLEKCSKATNDGLKGISALVKLRKLSLAENALFANALVQEIPSLTTLENLNLAGAGAGSALLESITNLRFLTSLDVSRVFQIAAEGLSSMEKLYNLRNFKIDECHSLTDSDMAHLARLPRLSNLSCTDNPQITFKGILKAAEATNLAHMDVQNCSPLSPHHISSLKTVNPALRITYTAEQPPTPDIQEASPEFLPEDDSDEGV